MAINGCEKELLSSVIAGVKNYDGTDPLRPWIQGIRKMKESLPPQRLKEKLPRFLQKCAQSFESDRRYRNDSRYLCVWIQLMDYVDDARVLLKKMEKNQIGQKKAMFYSAYALYYEKRKKFEYAEKMYHLGVQNLAEPAEELQKSYTQFLHRMNMLKKRKSKLQETMSRNGRSRNLPYQQGEASGNHKREIGQPCHPNNNNKLLAKEGNMDLHKPNPFVGDDTVFVKFVGSAIVGKSEAEDACHHGLVDPTVNLKEAMNAISSMFREPLESEPIGRRRSNQNKAKVAKEKNVFEVYVEESSEEKVHANNCKVSNPDSVNENSETELQKPFVGPFKIWNDDEDDDESDDNRENHNDSEEIMEEHLEGEKPPSSIIGNRTNDVRMREDTVIRRFMGSNDLGESQVENACHHGLVDPTINMKEAMDDINSMFGKPLNFVRAGKQKQQAKPMEQKPISNGFCILADDDTEEDLRGQVPESISSDIDSENDLFEQTIFTKEAMADINEMFGKPLDF